MNQKELAKTLMMISKNPLASMVYTEVFQRFEGYYHIETLINGMNISLTIHIDFVTAINFRQYHNSHFEVGIAIHISSGLKKGGNDWVLRRSTLRALVFLEVLLAVVTSF